MIEEKENFQSNIPLRNKHLLLIEKPISATMMYEFKMRKTEHKKSCSHIAKTTFSFNRIIIQKTIGHGHPGNHRHSSTLINLIVLFATYATKPNSIEHSRWRKIIALRTSRNKVGEVPITSAHFASNAWCAIHIVFPAKTGWLNL